MKWIQSYTKQRDPNTGSSGHWVIDWHLFEARRTTNWIAATSKLEEILDQRFDNLGAVKFNIDDRRCSGIYDHIDDLELNWPDEAQQRLHVSLELVWAHLPQVSETLDDQMSSIPVTLGQTKQTTKGFVEKKTKSYQLANELETLGSTELLTFQYRHYRMEN